MSDAAFALKERLGSLGEGEVSWSYGTNTVSVQGTSLGVQQPRLCSQYRGPSSSPWSEN